MNSETFLSEYADFVIACMAEDGWELTKDESPGGGFGIDHVPADQADKYEAAREACLAAAPALPPITDEIAGQLYDAYQRTAECLYDLGYDVGSAPPKQAWIDQRVQNEAYWTPYGAIHLQDVPDARSLLQQCPEAIGFD